MTCCSIKPRLLLTGLLLSIGILAPTSTLLAQPKFHESVNQAVERGREYLTGKLREVLRANPGGNYAMGHVALPLAALLKSGIEVDHPVVTDALKDLEARPPQKTYSVACYLLALDAYWEQLVKNATRNGKSLPRRATGPVLDRMLVMVTWLVNGRINKTGEWSYDSGSGRPDFSNSQFAILGLEIGVEHGIRVPSEVFHEIINHFIKKLTLDGGKTEVGLIFNPPVDQAFSRTSNPRRIRFSGRPGGWSYHGNNAKPTASMTAAGASSLLVAKIALKKYGELTPRLSAALENAIFTSMAWITRRFKDYLEGDNWFYYTLYSLEKVGDLGDISKYGEHDWYRRGATTLLERQEKNGSWLKKEPTDDHLSTAFALLFLTRATRLHVRGLAPPTIFTATGDKKQTDVGDLAYVDDLDSFVSASEFFLYLREARERSLIAIAEQIVRNYAVDRREELIPHLLLQWGNRSSANRRFAKKALKEITGETSSKPEFYRAWHEVYEKIVALLKAEVRDVEALGKALNDAPGMRLKIRVLDAIERENLLASAGHLAEELRVDDEDYRRRVHSILVRFSGRSDSFESAQTQSFRDAQAHEWSQWWSSNKDRIQDNRRLRNLVIQLNRTATPAPKGESTKKLGIDRDRIVDELVTAGEAAVPPILDEMGRSRYRIELVITLERISGERHGVLPEGWLRWWRQKRGR